MIGFFQRDSATWDRRGRRGYGPPVQPQTPRGRGQQRPGPATPDFRPAATLTENAASPPDDGFFDAGAKYIGAFKADDSWATGAWVSFDAN